MIAAPLLLLLVLVLLADQLTTCLTHVETYTTTDLIFLMFLISFPPIVISGLIPIQFIPDQCTCFNFLLHSSIVEGPVAAAQPAPQNDCAYIWILVREESVKDEEE